MIHLQQDSHDVCLTKKMINRKGKKNKKDYLLHFMLMARLSMATLSFVFLFVLHCRHSNTIHVNQIKAMVKQVQVITKKTKTFLCLSVSLCLLERLKASRSLSLELSLLQCINISIIVRCEKHDIAYSSSQNLSNERSALHTKLHVHSFASFQNIVTKNCQFFI